MTETPSEVLTIQEVARFLRVSAKTVYGLVKQQLLPSFRVGRAVRCRRTDVERFIRESGSRGMESGR